MRSQFPVIEHAREMFLLQGDSRDKMQTLLIQIALKCILKQRATWPQEGEICFITVIYDSVVI